MRLARLRSLGLLPLVPLSACLWIGDSEHAERLGGKDATDTAVGHDDSGDTASDTDIDTDTAAVADADGDGVSAAGGDCDDADADRYPGAVDVPDDGLDQNCTGSDFLLGDCIAAVAAAQLDGSLVYPADVADEYEGSTGSCLGGWAYSFSDFAALARDTSSSWETAGSDGYALALTAVVHLNDAHTPFLCTYEQVCVGDTCEGHSPNNPLSLSGGLRVDRLEGGEATTVVLADTGFSAATAWGDEYDTTCSVGQQEAALDSAGVSVGDVLEAALTDAGSQLAADLAANLATLASSSCTD